MNILYNIFKPVCSSKFTYHKNSIPKIAVLKNTLRNLQHIAPSPLKSSTEDAIFGMEFVFYLAQKVERENNHALQYASFGISKFSVFSDELV